MSFPEDFDKPSSSVRFEDNPVFDDGVSDISPQTPTSTPATSEKGFPHVHDFLNNARDQSRVLTEFAITDGVTAAYLADIDVSNPPAPQVIEGTLLTLTNMVIASENYKFEKGEAKYPKLRRLANEQVASVLLKLHHVIRIAPSAGPSDREYDLLAMYMAKGPHAGLYTCSENEIRRVARLYCSITGQNFKDIFDLLHDSAPQFKQCSDPDLIAVENGIFFYGKEDRDITVGGEVLRFTAKTLHSYTPDLVFLAKSKVRFNPNATSPVITMPDGVEWDVESWLADLFSTDGDDEFNEKNEGLSELIWEVLGAIVRPHVNWGKMAWFYSEVGNNGKGTLCSLMRNLVGPNTHASIPLSEMGKDFALEPLLMANAIIVDENDVGTFIDKAGNLKALVTRDVLQVNRKYRMPITFQFFGFMVQCLNELPRIKDKSDSFYRRQLFVPFSKSFTGAERRYIKDEYLQRADVLEYVLKRVLLDMDYYELSEPQATKTMLEEYKEHNDPVRGFWEEFREQFVWDLLPFQFSYDLFKSWFERVTPSGKVISRDSFVNNLVSILGDDDMWECADRRAKIRTSTRMDSPELLIAQYELKDWFNTSYTGTNPAQISSFRNKQSNYRGLRRRTTAPALTTPATTIGSVELNTTTPQGDPS